MRRGVTNTANRDSRRHGRRSSPCLCDKLGRKNWGREVKRRVREARQAFARRFEADPLTKAKGLSAVINRATRIEILGAQIQSIGLASGNSSLLEKANYPNGVTHSKGLDTGVILLSSNVTQLGPTILPLGNT